LEQKQGPQARSRSKSKQKNIKQELNKKLKDLKTKHKKDPKQLTNNI
jgi:hypothetical protein